MRRTSSRSRWSADGYLSCSFASTPWRGSSIVQGERGGAFHVSAKSVGNDFHDTNLRRRYFSHVAIGLSQVVPGQHAMHEAIFCSDESIRTVGELESAHHAQRVERKLLEEFPVAARVRAQSRGGAASRTSGHERRTHVGRLISIGFVGLELGERLDTSTRLFLGVRDELVELVILARAAREGARGEPQGSDEKQTAFLFREHRLALRLRPTGGLALFGSGHFGVVQVTEGLRGQ